MGFIILLRRWFKPNIAVLAALIDIPDERKTDFEVQYAAFRTGRQGLLVGYGLKHPSGFKDTHLQRA